MILPRRMRGVVALLCCACVGAALALCGCAPVERAPYRGLGDLLAAGDGGWREPVRLTREPGLAFNGDFNAAADRLVYVSTTDGNADLFLQERPTEGIEPPEALARHPARDRWPRLDRKGRRVLFVSTREDSKGDVWLHRPASWLRGPRLTRLTTDQTADDQPCWRPDGDGLFYASAPSLDEQFDLYGLRLGGEPVRLTHRGGQMPDCSPDGRHLAFVSDRAPGVPNLYVLRLSDGSVARLTRGERPCLDPCWSADGRRVFFTWIPLDSNGDGRIGRGDASCMASVAFSEARLAAGETPPVRMLTVLTASAASPRSTPGGFTCTLARRSGAAGVFALGRTGEAPDFGRASEFLRFAREADRAGADDPYRRLLAWQNALWAAREAEAGGDVEFDLPRREEAAVAALEMGRVLVALGHADAARTAFERVADEWPSARPAAAAAELELLRLRRAGLEGRLRVEDALWDALLAEARVLSSQSRLLAEQARAEGQGEEAQALDRAASLAQVEAGLTLLARRDYASALEALEAVPADWPQEREACARALLASAEAYRPLGDPQAVRGALLRTLREYPDVTDVAGAAATRVVDTILGPDSGFEEQVAELRAIAEQYADVPVLPALAQNRIGDLFYGRKEHLRAIEEYRRTIEGHAGEGEQAAAAHLATGRIYTEREDYEKAVESFGRAERLEETRAGGLYERARRGYVNSLLTEAARALELGDVPLALDAYGRVLEFDPGLTAAHRGSVQSQAGLGRAAEAIFRYRPRVLADPRDHLSHYALALAYSYYGPDDWAAGGRPARTRAKIDREALRLVGQAVALSPDDPYYHQLRGFLLSRLALTAGDDELRLRALDAYMAALGLSRAEDDLPNYANLLFNVGEGYMLLDQPVTAYDYHRRAVEAGFRFTGAHGEAALTQMSRSAVAAGDYPGAVALLERALAIQDAEPGQAGPTDALHRRAATLDRLALALHLDGDYAAAASAYGRYAEALGEVMAADPAGRSVYQRNLLRAYRNLAVNLYLGARQEGGTGEQLREAYDLLTEVARLLDEVGVARGAADGGAGLVTLEVQVALGEAGAEAAFDVNSEKRLLYTYLARIEGVAGDHAAAAGYLRRKLDLYARTKAARTQPDLLTEQAIVWTQVARHELEDGSAQAAAQACREAAALERRAGNLEGEAAAMAFLGRASLLAAGSGQARPDELAQDAAAHEGLIGRIREAEAGHLTVLEAELSANLAALLARGAPGGEEAQ